MPANDSLTDLERHAWKSNFDDGVFDIMVGCMLVLLGVSALAGNSRLLYPLYFALVGGFVFLRYRVVVPRAGVARFGPARRQRTAFSVAVLVASSLLGVAATVAFALDGGAAAWLRANPIVFEAGFPLLVVAVFSALAQLMDVARIHLAGLLTGLAFGIQLRLDSPLGFLIGGAVVTLAGAVLLTRFLHTHPPLSAEDRSHVR